MSAVWSSEQQRLLAALGYTLYRPATLPTANSTATVALSTTLAPSPATGSGSGASRAIDPLLRALLLAADLDPGLIGDTASWLRAQQIPSLTQLRNNPAAKRALWPRLRALRREQIVR